MTLHRFQLSESSLEQIDLNKSHSGTEFNKFSQLSWNPGKSLEELSKEYGFGSKKTLKMINQLKSDGKVTVLRFPIYDITGRLNYSTRYIIELE